MRSLLITVLFILRFGSVNCQNSISLNNTYCYTGSNISLVYARQFKKHRISLGLKYHINREPRGYPFDDAFAGRYYAQNFWQHIGAVGGYEYIFLPKLWKFQMSAFYNIQFLRCPTKHLDAILKPSGNKYYFMKTSNNLEQYIGLSLALPIKEVLAVKVSYGLGEARLWDMDLSINPGVNTGSTWDGISSYLSFGISGIF